MAQTPNQFVAERLTWARVLHGWTQQEVADRLGGSWTRIGVSAAERSVTGNRIRRFTADDLAAFSRVFGIPVSFWFEADHTQGDWRPPVAELRKRRMAELESGLPLPEEGER